MRANVLSAFGQTYWYKGENAVDKDRRRYKSMPAMRKALRAVVLTGIRSSERGSCH